MIKIRRSWLVARGAAAALIVAGCASGATPSVAPSVGPSAAAPATTTLASPAASPSPTSTSPPTATPSATPTAAATAAAANAVSIVDFGFKPTETTVKAGTTVTWTNHGRTHTVTADDGTFDSGHISSGGTFSMTFKKAGTYADLLKL